MSIAFSKLPIVRSTATGTTRAELIASLAAILVSAGWASSAETGGYSLLCTSPQGFQAKLWLQDLGRFMLGASGTAVSVRMSCADGSNLSPEYKLLASAARSYDVIAGVCQAFVAIPDLASEAAVDGYWGHPSPREFHGCPTMKPGHASGLLIPELPRPGGSLATACTVSGTAGTTRGQTGPVTGQQTA